MGHGEFHLHAVPSASSPASCATMARVRFPGLDTQNGLQEQAFDHVKGWAEKQNLKNCKIELLTEVATVLIANPQIKKVQVAGHTDSKGKNDFNKELSQQRADSARTWLVEHDVPADRLEAVGYGETKPIASNGSRKGRAQNRRVEFVIVDSAPTTDDAEKE